MRTFRAKISRDNRGREWSPAIVMYCPYCKSSLEFYSQLPFDECKFCRRRMPFTSSMAKSMDRRVEYHVQGETEDISEQSNVNFLRLREGD